MGQRRGAALHGHHLGSASHVPWVVVCVVLAAVAWRRLPGCYTLYATVVLVASLSSTNLDSFERYALGGVPPGGRGVDGHVPPAGRADGPGPSALAMTGYALAAFLGVVVPWPTTRRGPPSAGTHRGSKYPAPPQGRRPPDRPERAVPVGGGGRQPDCRTGSGTPGHTGRRHPNPRWPPEPAETERTAWQRPTTPRPRRRHRRGGPPCRTSAGGGHRRGAGRTDRRLPAGPGRRPGRGASSRTRCSAGSAAPSSATAGGSTSAATASSPRSSRWRSSGTRSCPTRTSCCGPG